MVTHSMIQDAQERIKPYIKRTRLEKNQTLSKLLDTNVYLKLELFQKTGSFKSRGAISQFLNFTTEQKERGVVGVSGGNFAHGVAYAGQTLKVKTRILMPEGTPQNYLDATKGYGADVELLPTIAEAFAKAQAYGQEGMSFVHPFDDPILMAGNGSIGLEILEDLPNVTDVFVSIGGGGLMGGVSTALKANKASTNVWGVETEGADAMTLALAANEVVNLNPTSLAKTLSAPYVSKDTLALAQKNLEAVLLVSDKDAYHAQRLLMERAKLYPELAASCTLAAAQSIKENLGEHVVLIICGGNVSLDDIAMYHKKFEGA